MRPHKREMERSFSRVNDAGFRFGFDTREGTTRSRLLFSNSDGRKKFRRNDHTESYSSVDIDDIIQDNTLFPLTQLIRRC